MEPNRRECKQLAAALALWQLVIRDGKRPSARQIDVLKNMATDNYALASYTEGELEGLKKELLTAEPPSTATIKRVLGDPDLDGVKEGKTVEEVLARLGRLIDHCMEPPCLFFQLAGDERWWVATVEGCISEANPEAVHERLQEQKEEANAD